MSSPGFGLGWWQASDGHWYPPEAHPDYTQTTAPSRPLSSNFFHCPVDIFIWANSEVAYRQNRNALITTSPELAMWFYGSRALGNRASRKRAEKLAQPKWHFIGSGELVIDETAITLQEPGVTNVLPFEQIHSWHCEGNDFFVGQRKGAPPFLFRTLQSQALASAFGKAAIGKTWKPARAENWAACKPFTSWCQQDHRFTFGVTEGWGPVDGNYMKAAAFENQGLVRTLFALTRSDVDGDWYIEVAEFTDLEAAEACNEISGCSQNELEAFGRNWSGRRAQDTGGWVTGPSRLITIDGEIGVMINFVSHIPNGYVALSEIYFARHQSGFKVYYGAFTQQPSEGNYSRYFPDFQTAIATWHWYV